MSSEITPGPITIPDAMLQEWQTVVNILAELMHVPAGLIMRVVDSDIEIFVSSQTEGNPYTPGDKEVLVGSGLYCETVLAKKHRLIIPNALRDEDWKNNPDIKLNMISYLGYPLFWPDGAPFGTICVLDRKENAYSETYEQLLLKFQGIIQSQLELLHVNKSLGEENKSLQELVEEMRTLREIVPICSFCKNIRDDKGFWEQVEFYITRYTGTTFSHGICPACAKEHYDYIPPQSNGE